MIIKNGMIHDGCGRAYAADIRIKDGLIAAIGKGLKDDGEQAVDAQGRDILPGFIDPVSHWGINGNGTEIRPMGDDNDEKSDPIVPNMNVVYAFNGRAVTLQQLYAYGITAIGVAPTNNEVMGGRMGVFEVEGTNPLKMVIREDAGLKASVTKQVKKTFAARGAAPQTDMKIFQMLSEQLRLAKEYDPKDKKVKRDEKLASVKAVIDGRMPLFVACDSASDIQHVIAITKPYRGIKLVLVNGGGVGAADTYLIGKDKALIVCFNECDADPDTYGTDYDGLAALAGQGLKIGLAAVSSGFGGREDLLWNAMDMVKAMGDPEKVLPMLTANNADILGVGDRLGRIAVGLRADLVVWSANPLTTFKAQVETTYIKGRQVYRKGDAMRCYL